MSAFILKAKKDIAKLPDRDLLSQSLLTDGVILAEAAAKGTTGEKYCAASVDSADPRLLPLVKGRPGRQPQKPFAPAVRRSAIQLLGQSVQESYWEIKSIVNLLYLTKSLFYINIVNNIHKKSK